MPEPTTYNYVAFVLDEANPASPEPTRDRWELLGTVEARDPDAALAVTAEKWPPAADQTRKYAVCLLSKFRSGEFRGRATIIVEPAVSEGAPDPEPEPDADAS